MRALAFAILAPVVAIVAGAGALEVAAARDRRRLRAPCPLDDDEPLPRAARAVAAGVRFVAECLAIGRAALACLLPRGGPRRDDPVHGMVVLVPGSALLAPAMRVLARRLERDGWVVSFAVPPLGVRDLARRADRLAARLAAVRRAAGGALVDVVAHGTGGLVARACLAAGGPSAGVGRLVTLGTPHQGSVAYRWFRADPLAAAHCPGAPELRALGADDRVPSLADCTAIASPRDAFTVPIERAYWPGAFNVEVDGVGHVGLLYAARVYELVRENLAAPREPARAGAARPA